jgi:hypothetical protein
MALSRTTPVGTAVALQQAAAATFNGAAGGWIGYAVSTSVQGSIGATLSDVTGLAVAVTVGTSRRLKITGYIPVAQITASGQITSVIMEGAVQLGGVQRNVAATGVDLMLSTVVVTPGAGSHTYKLQLATTSGSVSSNCSTTNPGFLLVEDIGPA